MIGDNGSVHAYRRLSGVVRGLLSGGWREQRVRCHTVFFFLLSY